MSKDLGAKYDKLEKIIDEKANELAKKTGKKSKELERIFWKNYRKLPKKQRNTFKKISRKIGDDEYESLMAGVLGTGLGVFTGNIVGALMVGGLMFGATEVFGEVKEKGVDLINYTVNTLIRLEKSIKERKKKKLEQVV